MLFFKNEEAALVFANKTGRNVIDLGEDRAPNRRYAVEIVRW